VLITGIDSEETLDQALEAARTFRPMNAGQVSALISKTAKAAAQGEFELFKTNSIFDSTAENPEWPGGGTKHVRELAAT
jgi:hypothetical protein